MRAGGKRSFLTDKVKSAGELARELAAVRAKGGRVVFTNGCFDILHYGHVAYLEKARRLGDFLVVGINSDLSVRRLKGPSRPVNHQRFRAAVVAALESVDGVVIFGEDTPLALIKKLKPDVLAKGGDWKKKNIVGSDFVEGRGGRVVPIAFEKGFSTTSIINNCQGNRR